MNQQLGRLFLAGLCCLAVASVTRAQQYGNMFEPDDAPRPSHRPLDGNVGDLSQAEDLLARRLHRTHNLQDLQDLLKPFQDNPGLLKQFAGLKADDLKKLEDAVQNNPAILDDPKFRDLLAQADKLKHGDTVDAEKRKELEDLAKGFFEKHKEELSPLLHQGNPVTGGPSDPTHSPVQPPPPPPHNPTPQKLPPPSPTASSSNWLSRDVVNGMADLLKNVDRSPEGEAMRDDLLREFSKMNSNPSTSSSGLADFLKSVVTSEDAAWLARNFRPPSMPNVGNGWSASPAVSAGSAISGDSGDMLEGAVWAAVLVLLGITAWMVVRMARRQAANARAKDWTPGPWPVHPSRVSTREDLIRAFEHLAYLCLGRVARTLNHLDVASRLGRSGEDRAEAAGRLAHLYEQARYAPPNEALPPEELTAARGDLTALAGAAA